MQAGNNDNKPCDFFIMSLSVSLWQRDRPRRLIEGQTTNERTSEGQTSVERKQSRSLLALVHETASPTYQPLYVPWSSGDIGWIDW